MCGFTKPTFNLVPEGEGVEGEHNVEGAHVTDPVLEAEAVRRAEIMQRREELRGVEGGRGAVPIENNIIPPVQSDMTHTIYQLLAQALNLYRNVEVEMIAVTDSELIGNNNPVSGDYYNGEADEVDLGEIFEVPEL